jgi:hypothetical protein
LPSPSSGIRVTGSGSRQEFAKIHEAVMATSPDFYNLSRPVVLKPILVVE